MYLLAWENEDGEPFEVVCDLATAEELYPVLEANPQVVRATQARVVGDKFIGARGFTRAKPKKNKAVTSVDRGIVDATRQYGEEE